MSQFFDEFQANVRHANRARYYRLARFVAICLIAALAGGMAMAVETVTGSKGAATAMALIGAFAGIGFWWMISDGVYDRLVTPEDASDLAPQAFEPQSAAWNPPPAAAPWAQPLATTSAEDAGDVVDLQYAGAPKPALHRPPSGNCPLAKPTAPPQRGSVVPWVLGGLALSFLLMCGGIVAASALLVSRVQQQPQLQPLQVQFEPAQDPFAAMRAEHQRQIDRMNENHRAMQRRHQEMQRNFHRSFP